MPGRTSISTTASPGFGVATFQTIPAYTGAGTSIFLRTAQRMAVLHDGAIEIYSLSDLIKASARDAALGTRLPEQAARIIFFFDRNARACATLRAKTKNHERACDSSQLFSAQHIRPHHCRADVRANIHVVPREFQAFLWNCLILIGVEIVFGGITAGFLGGNAVLTGGSIGWTGLDRTNPFPGADHVCRRSFTFYPDSNYPGCAVYRDTRKTCRDADHRRRRMQTGCRQSRAAHRNFVADHPSSHRLCVAVWHCVCNIGWCDRCVWWANACYGSGQLRPRASSKCRRDCRFCCCWF